MTDTPKFSACPFCGEAEELLSCNYIGTYWVKCYGCRCEGPQADSEGEATEKWNIIAGREERRKKAEEIIDEILESHTLQGLGGERIPIGVLRAELMELIR